MTDVSLAYSNIYIDNKEIRDKKATEEEIKTIWTSLTEEQDVLSFMEPFDFPNLEELKLSLAQSGHYTEKQIEEIIAGISTLPHYNED